MATMMKSHFDAAQKQICLDFMSCDEDGIGSLYQIRKKIKYVITIPGVERRVYAPNAKAAESAFMRHGIDFSMWQIYRYFKRGGTEEEPKLMGATIRKA